MITLLSDRYELHDVLGSGGMARVYAGFDRLLSRRVAIKILREDLSMPDVRERFVREARTAAALTHPSAVAVFDTGEHDRTAFIVMELVEGGSLADRLGNGALHHDDAVQIGIHVLGALGAAHRRGLVHRDIKPANILLPQEGPAKLADFGIAKSVMEATANLTATGQLVGTPRYMSPEQVLGRSATAQSDLYAMGVVLYEMLAGQPPFDAPNPIAVLRAHQDDPPPPLVERAPHVPAHVLAVVERALRKNPEHRFADADAMAEALHAATHPAPEPVLPAAHDRTALLAAPGDHRSAAPTEVLRPSVGRTVRADAPPVVAKAPSRMRPLIVAALVGLLLLGASALALGSTGSGQERGNGVAAGPSTPPEAEDAADETPPAAEQQVEVEEPPPPEPEPEPVPEPPAPEPGEDATTVDLPRFVAALASNLDEDPAAVGPKGPELLKRLREVLDSSGGDRRKRARDTRDKINSWLKKEEIDPPVGSAALTLLEPYASSGRERDDDDD